jgi:hypothetical protein
MDFVEGLPLSSAANSVLVVVDKFSKFAHFLPLRHPFTAASVARVFMDNIFKLHGLPVAIISDRGKVFTTKFWQSLFQIAGTELRMSTAYHPQSDGQTERVNQCMETYLRCFAHACPKSWSQWLSLAEYWYNTSFHSALGRSPFEVLYGCQPRHLGLDISLASPVSELTEWFEDRELMQALVRQHLLRAQARMKRQADKHRVDRQFSVGDLVFLKLQSYVQSSVARRANHKLAFKFFGPYRVEARIGQVAYKLSLPPGASVHPVFHVSQLKKSPGSQPVSASLPSDFVEFQVPVRIVQRRWSAGAHPVEQALVEWSHMPPALATWESVEQLQQQFPRAPAWGQAVSEDRGNVSAPEPDEHITVPEQAGTSASSRPKRSIRPNSLLSGPEWHK